MWNNRTRKKYERKQSGYASDLTEGEWEIIKAQVPLPAKTGRPRDWEMRRIVEAVFYLLRTGCQWRMLPQDFPPWQTVYRWFARLRDDGTWEKINYELVQQARESIGREASPTAGVVDSQSLKATETSGPRGYDAGKKINGCKRHILTDTEGHLLSAIVHPADIQDRDGAVLLFAQLLGLYPFLVHIFVDGGYAGEKLRNALVLLGAWTLEVVKRSDQAQAFVLLGRRWVVERTFVWFGRNRRLSKNFESLPMTSAAYVYAASILLLTRRLARS